MNRNYLRGQRFGLNWLPSVYPTYLIDFSNALRYYPKAMRVGIFLAALGLVLSPKTSFSAGELLFLPEAGVTQEKVLFKASSQAQCKQVTSSALLLAKSAISALPEKDRPTIEVKYVYGPSSENGVIECAVVYKAAPGPFFFAKIQSRPQADKAVCKQISRILSGKQNSEWIVSPPQIKNSYNQLLGPVCSVTTLRLSARPQNLGSFQF